MAEAPTLSHTSDRKDTINWLSHRRLITSSPEEALRHCPADFAGVPDLLPSLRDDGLNNLQAVLEEVFSQEPRDKFKLRSVGRIKQAMCEAMGDTAEPDVKEVKGKLQRVGEALTGKRTLALLAKTVSKEMSFHSDERNKKKGVDFIKKLYSALNGNGDDNQSVRRARQLKLVGPSNNGKTCLAQWMARMWVASARGHEAQGGWIETYVTMETMDAHLWSARESTGSDPREVWGPLRYLFYKSWEFPHARFALVLHESNRGGLFNALNRIWWEKRRNYDGPGGQPDDPMRNEHLPPNLALIFTENPKTADYATIGDGDEALRTRLPPECTFALVRGGTNESELAELGFSGEEGRHFSTENVGLFYAMAKGGYSSDDWKEHLGCLANDTDFSPDDDRDFYFYFEVEPNKFRKMVAGEQIDIIRNNPPPVSEATHLEALPENQQIIESVQVPRKEEVRKYLRQRPDTLLAFVHDEVANRKTNKQFYKYLRGQLVQRQFQATVDDLVDMAQNMTPAEKTTFGLNEYSFEQRCKTTGQLISWISFTQGMGPSVKIVHNGSELTWDAFVQARTGGNGQNAPEPAAAAPGGAPTNTQMAPLSPSGQQSTQVTPYNFLLQNDEAVLVFFRDQRDGVTVHTDCQGYYLWLLEKSGEQRQLTMREIINLTRPQPPAPSPVCPDNGDIRELLRNYNPPGGDSPSGILSCIGRWLQSSTIHFKIRVNGSDYTWRELLRARDRSPAADERPAQRPRIE